MFDYVVRFFKRLVVLTPGLLLAGLSADKIYPFFHTKVPAILALSATYIVIAYGLIPAAIRVFRLFVQPSHIPLYSTTPDGLASDPINIGLVGTRAQVVAAMNEIGWFEADPYKLLNLARMAVAVLFKVPYPHAPFSNLYLFGRHQDLGFELPIDNNPRHRHHVRFWSTDVDNDKRHRSHVFFWQKHRAGQQKMFWVGAASLDRGLGIVRHTGQISHSVHPDTNAERDLIVKQLKSKSLVAGSRSIKLGKPYKIRNRVLRAHLHTDGRMKIIELKS